MVISIIDNSITVSENREKCPQFPEGQYDKLKLWLQLTIFVIID